MKKVLVMVLAAAFMLAMYVPAFSADWDLYGSARMTTFWTDKDPGGDAEDVDGLTHTLQGNSRIGGSVSQGAISGKFEVGFYTDKEYDAHVRDTDDDASDYEIDYVRTRILAGTVDLAGGQLLIGQDYTPVNLFYSNQVFGDDLNMLDLGVAWQIREPMVQYSVNGFKIALVQNQADDNPVNQDGDEDVELPLLEASYHMDLGNFFFDFAGGFQTYEVKGIDGTNNNEDIDSYGLVLGHGGDLDQFYYRVTGFYGQNVNDMGWAQKGSMNAKFEDNEIVDSDDFGGALVLGMNLQNGQAVEVGAGYNNGEPDASGYEEDENAIYYANYTLPLTANGNAFIVPEVGYYDYFENDDGEDEGDMFYAGLKWQVNF